MYYMNSNNITMHKFGIENNYISMAMNTMLGKTNNSVKSMNISETNAMMEDHNWHCILDIAVFIILIIGIIGGLIFSGGSLSALLFTLIVVEGGGEFASSVALYYLPSTCHWGPDPYAVYIFPFGI